MIIPKLHYISQGNSPKEHLENIQKACSSGAELVQLRLKNVSEKKVLKIAGEAREITSHFQTRLLINDYYKIAKTVKADGVHLGKTDACPTLARKHLYTWQMIGGTANTLQDCEALLTKEVDYISLGPFRLTTTKDNLAPVLGLNGYTAIMDVLETETPIIGVGGITTDDVTAILETGISGIAVSGEITRDFNTVKLFNQLLNASATAEQRHTFE
ncbi:thiamine-phosphate pyrophosphorylase [Gelidibacter algens]|uniref:Thiamine-phosphate synthase n=1 Tax=Gelidibacter algens TaxID=49280 RepID=A0A1A7R3S7_9FLAO|nr:thiamine phosphate synthase [Gelidibacter algens]OBX26501.1 thiamine-phosphate diphosphorylase [Gelidibacter algens]RAJ26676.1 thiamine-phosphate pyrophosphorylase [Gelidibacter algens]